MNMALVLSRKMFKMGILIVVLIEGMAAGGWADVQVPYNGEMNAVETDMIKISDGARLILPKGMKTTQIGGQIIIEDLQAFLLRRIEELEKKLSEIQAANTKLTAEIEAMKSQDSGQRQAVLEKMLVDLTARQQGLEKEFAQLKTVQSSTSPQPLPSSSAVPFPPLQMPATSSQ